MGPAETSSDLDHQGRLRSGGQESQSRWEGGGRTARTYEAVKGIVSLLTVWTDRIDQSSDGSGLDYQRLMMLESGRRQREAGESNKTKSRDGRAGEMGGS